MINLDAYFKRINFNIDNNTYPPATLETLKALHRAQVMAIPFEDLVLHETQNFKKCGKHLKKDLIKLDENSLFDKLVTQKRGGYCHENNELFALVLLQLGFKVERLLGRVVYPTGIELPKGHKLLLVTIDDKKYIADVGYGGNGLIEPIALHELNEPFKQGIDTFKLIKKEDHFILQVKMGEKFVDQYEFSLQVYKPLDFHAINKHISSTDSNSIFVKLRMCIKPTEYGRLILVDDTLKIRTENGTTAYPIKDEEQYRTLLQTLFDIDLGNEAKLNVLPKKETAANDQTYDAKMIQQITLGFAQKPFQTIKKNDVILKR